MTTSHTINFPVFDPAWPWAGASVLLTDHKHVVFIKRSLTMPTHAGQMAFFGGHRKPHENDPFEVARREFTEESGISSDFIRCCGVLEPVKTARAQPIIPVVAELLMPMHEFLSQARSNGEWSDLLAVPWSELNHPDKWSWGAMKGRTEYKVLTVPIAAGRYQQHQGMNLTDHVLWGATARMVWTYLSLYYHPRA